MFTSAAVTFLRQKLVSYPGERPLSSSSCSRRPIESLRTKKGLGWDLPMLLRVTGRHLLTGITSVRTLSGWPWLNSCSSMSNHWLNLVTTHHCVDLESFIIIIGIMHVYILPFLTKAVVSPMCVRRLFRKMRGTCTSRRSQAKSWQRNLGFRRP